MGSAVKVLVAIYYGVIIARNGYIMGTCMRACVHACLCLLVFPLSCGIL